MENMGSVKAKKKKIILTVVIAIAAALLLLIVGGLLFLRAELGKISYEPDEEEPVYYEGMEGQEPFTIDPAYAAGQGIHFPDREPVHDPNVLNVLFLGTDFKFTEGDSGRADSNMLCSLNLQRGEIKLISFERGIGVPIPGRGSDLLTHAYRWGGARLSQSIISQMFCVEVDGYAQVDFGSFADIIDALGGVDVELTEQEALALNGAIPTNTWAWAEVHEGWNHLGGHDTLEYCRLRSIDSDWNRQRRQRTVLEQLQKSLRSASPSELLGLTNTVLPMIHTNLSRDDILTIVRSMPKLLQGEVTQLQVPDQNYQEGFIRCNTEYESKKIDNFLYNAGYEISSPY